MLDLNLGMTVRKWYKYLVIAHTQWICLQSRIASTWVVDAKLRSYFVSDVLVTLVQKELDKKYWSLFDKDGVFNNNSANDIKLNQSLMVGIMVK